MRALPLFRRVAVCRCRALIIGPVGLNVFVAGSYNSAVKTEQQPRLVPPPARRTFPVLSMVAVCEIRVENIGGRRLNPTPSGSVTVASDGYIPLSTDPRAQ